MFGSSRNAMLYVGLDSNPQLQSNVNEMTVEIPMIRKMPRKNINNCTKLDSNSLSFFDPKRSDVVYVLPPFQLQYLVFIYILINILYEQQ